MRVALAAFLLLAAGCSAPVNPSAEIQEGPPEETGLLFKVSDGLVAADEIPGLQVRVSNGQHVTTWSPHEGVGRDTMHLLLLQATAATAYTLEDSHNVQFATNSDEPFATRETACAAHVVGPGIVGDGDPPAQPVPGEYLVALASGQATGQTPPALLDFELSQGAVYGIGSPQAPGTSGGSVGGVGRREGALQSGEWMLFGMGLSGISWREVGRDSEMGFNLTTEAPMRVIELPPTTLLCGMGFSYLEGAEFHAGYPGYQVGGALELEGLYGAAFDWNDICWPLDGPWPFNLARLEMDGISTDLTQATVSMTQGTFSTEAGRLSVEQWKGHPMWTFVGLPLALEPTSPTKMPGCLQ